MRGDPRRGESLRADRGTRQLGALGVARDRVRAGAGRRPRRGAARPAGAPRRPSARPPRRARARRRRAAAARGSGTSSSSRWHDRARADDPLAAAEHERRHGRLAEAQPLLRHVQRGRHLVQSVRLALQLQRALRADARMRAVDDVERVRHRASIGRAATRRARRFSARYFPAHAPRRRRRQHADPLRHLRRRRADASTGASRRCASRPPTSSARSSRTCSRCAASRSPTCRARSSPRPCRSSARSGGRWASATSATTTLVVGPGIRSGMPIRYENPREIGADRLVNAVAAYEQGRRRLRRRRLRHRDHVRPRLRRGRVPRRRDRARASRSRWRR